MVYKWFDKKTGGAIKNENVSPKELAEELRKARKKYTHYSQTIYETDLADVQLIVIVIKEFVFQYVLLMFSVNSHGLIL